MKQKFLLPLILVWSLLPTLSLGVEILKDPLQVQNLTDKVQISNMQSMDLHFSLSLPEKYHAYQDSFKVEVISPKDSVSVQSFEVKPVVEFFDKVTKKKRMGLQERGDLNVKLILKNLNFKDEKFLKLNLTYQACSEEFCLLPTHKIIEQPIEVSVQESANPSAAATIGQLNISDLIQQRSLLAFLFVFFAGILTSFTPCIFPMIPITLSILGSQTVGQTRWRGFWISVVYVHGIATTYSILGLIAAQTGSLFGNIMSNPYAIITISIIFILMALSLFDFYEIQIPLFIRSRIGNAKVSQNYVGAYLSGLIAGIVASPCVGPVLVALLAYVAQSRNLFFGFTLLFTYAIGMGLIFIVMGTFSQLLSKLPRSGPWMVRIKKAFGTILILMAVYYTYPLAKNYLSISSSKVEEFTKWQPYNEEKLKNNVGQNVVIIDFFAEWCQACHELDKYTYSNLEVQSRLSKAVLFKVDATNENATTTPILQKYGIIGLPTVIFIEKDGTIRTDLTLTGYEAPADFLQRLNKLNSL